MGLFLLFDSGASESFVREKYVKHLKHKFVNCNDNCEIAGGTFTIDKEVFKLRFSLPEFGSSKIITSKFKINSSTDHGMRYPRPKKVIFDNGSEFKKDFVPLLQDFAIKPACTTIKNPQSNAPVKRIHQVVGQMMAAQDLKTRIFDFINLWGPILTSICTTHLLLSDLVRIYSTVMSNGQNIT